MVTALHSLVAKYKGFPDGSSGKELTCNVGAVGSIPRSGRSTGRGNGNPFQYSCPENPMDRGIWRVCYSPCITESQTWLNWLSMHACGQAQKYTWMKAPKQNYLCFRNNAFLALCRLLEEVIERMWLLIHPRVGPRQSEAPHPSTASLKYRGQPPFPH